ncbi:MAG: Uma2 family endonuclease [Cyanobacteria bacterium J06626_18]
MTQLAERQQSDQRIVQTGISWDGFKKIQEGFAGCPGVRLSYYQGTVEVVTVGAEHEIYKSIIGMLIEIFLVEKGIEFTPTGSMDQEKEGAASAQADESYCLGSYKPVPDLSVEVVFSSGGPSKLARYRVIGVPEVWFWEDGVFTVYCLRDSDYERVTRSELLPEMDFDLLSRSVLMSSRVEAARTFRAALGNA